MRVEINPNHEAQNPSLVTKLNNLVIDSQWSFVTYIRNPSFDSEYLMPHDLLNLSYIVAHNLPSVKAFGNWMFATKYIPHYPKVYNYAEYHTACGVNWKIELSFSSKLFQNNFGVFFATRDVNLPFVCAPSQSKFLIQSPCSSFWKLFLKCWPCD